jgi:GT2 family glycosyltransferase
MMCGPPKASVIIPCYNSNSTLRACLDSLSRQTYKNFEIILIDSTPGDDAAGRIAGGCDLTHYHHLPMRLLPHAARNLGAAMASGEILAFTDPDMAIHPQWLEHLIAAHLSGKTVIGGRVDSLPGYWNRAVHITKYGWWVPGGPAAPRPQLPSGNFSLSRQLFQAVGGFPAHHWSGDTELSYRLRDQGHQLWLLAEAVTVHLDRAPPGQFLRERFARGFDTAQSRKTSHSWSRGHCLARLLAAPLVPLVMLVRCGRYLGESGRILEFLAALPVVFAGLVAWAAGEAAAYAEGVWRR